MNYTTHSEGSVIRCAEFHPKNAIGLVAGVNGTASLFQIDGKMNPKLKSIHLENFPIKTAHFTSNGKQFLAGSQQHGHFFAYDLTKDKVMRIPWKEDKEHTSMQKFEVSLNFLSFPNNNYTIFQKIYTYPLFLFSISLAILLCSFVQKFGSQIRWSRLFFRLEFCRHF